MKRLTHSDWQILVSAIEKLHSDFNLQTLPERALSAASMVIAADSVTFTGFGSRGEYAGLLWDTGKISPEDMEIFAAHMYENPLVGAYVIERRPETLTVTDLIGREDYRKTTVYNEFYKRIGVESQLVAPLPISEELFMSCSVNTGRADFTERDRLLLTLFKPHLVNAIRNSLAYGRLESALETEACGLISICSEGKPAFVSEFARQLLDKYFADEKREADSLPETVHNWIKNLHSGTKTTEPDSPPKPLRIENQTGELTVRCAYNSTTCERTLMLEEKKFNQTALFDSFGLTGREAEILFLMMRGKTDGGIAHLCGISLRTVHKHAENIYTKLGVETRTAAMLKALEINSF